ncbi:MAG: cell division protein ZapA [Candidatus Sumerlaeota bacterium]|nr:cell division protein ZapA [Candidatus Sumerlaeota bacterium]
MSEKQRLELTILGEVLRLRVEEPEIERVKRAAQYLEQKISALQKAGGTGPNLQRSVLAGLDVAHELMQERDGVGSASKQQSATLASAEKRINSLITRIDKELG